MDFETVIVENENHIGIITLNRPDQLNTFTTTLAGELDQSMVDMDQVDHLMLESEIEVFRENFMVGPSYLDQIF